MPEIDDKLGELFRDIIGGNDCIAAREELMEFLRDNEISVDEISLRVNRAEAGIVPQRDQKLVIDFLRHELERHTGRPVVLPDASDLERFKVFLQLCMRKFGLGRGWKVALSNHANIPLEDIRRYERGDEHIPDSVFDSLNRLPDVDEDQERSELPEEIALAIIDRQLSLDEISQLIKQKRSTIRHRASERDLAVADAMIDHYNCTIPDTALLLGLTEGQIRSSYHNKVRKPRIMSQEVATDDRPMNRDELLHIGIKLNARKGSMQGAKRSLSEFLDVPHTTINDWDARRETIPPEIAQKLREWYHSH